MMYLLQYLRTCDLFMATSPIYSLQDCLDKSCKLSYHKSWRFELLFAQGALNYSVLKKGCIDLSLCDKCKIDIKPRSPLRKLTHLYKSASIRCSIFNPKKKNGAFI